MGQNSAGLSIDDLYVKLLDALKQESASIKTDITKEIKLENNRILEKLEQQNNKIVHLEEKYNNLELRCLNLERQYRKNNVVIFGLQVNPGESLLQFVLSKFRELLEINIVESDINNIYKIKSEKGTPIKVGFVSYLKKSLIFQNIHKLRGKKKIFITHDLCFEDRKDLKILQQHLKLARTKNQFAKIKGNKLVVNEDIFTVGQLKMMNLVEFQEQTEEASTANCLYPKSNSAPSTPNSNAENQFFDVTESSASIENSVPAQESTIFSPSIPPAKKKRTNTVSLRSGSTSTNNSSSIASRSTSRLKSRNT